MRLCAAHHHLQRSRAFDLTLSAFSTLPCIAWFAVLPDQEQRTGSPALAGGNLELWDGAAARMILTQLQSTIRGVLWVGILARTCFLEVLCMH